MIEINIKTKPEPLLDTLVKKIAKWTAGTDDRRWNIHEHIRWATPANDIKIEIDELVMNSIGNSGMTFGQLIAIINEALDHMQREHRIFEYLVDSEHDALGRPVTGLSITVFFDANIFWEWQYLPSMTN